MYGFFHSISIWCLGWIDFESHATASFPKVLYCSFWTQTQKLLAFVFTNTNYKQSIEWCQPGPVTLTIVFIQNRKHHHCNRRLKTTCRFRCSSITWGLLLNLNSQLLTQRCHPVVTSFKGTSSWCDDSLPASSQLVGVRNYGVLLRFLLFMSVKHTKTHHAEYQTWHTLEAIEKWTDSW